MGNLKTNISIKNKYELEVYSADGVLKNRAYAYNLVTNYFWSNMVFGTTSTAYWFRYLSIGTGIGTPVASRNTFFKHLATREVEVVSFTKEYPTSTRVVRATFPASSSIVGTITEVGFSTTDSGSICLTHALLQDSEGNPITIQKTDTDILVVTATVYITVNAEEPLKLVPAEQLGFLNRFGGSGYGAYTLGDVCLSACKLLPTYSALASGSAVTSGNGNAATRSFTSDTKRIGSATGNGAAGLYINTIYTDEYGTIDLPNADFFPVYTMQPTTVGVGDGTTTSFVCPIPDFIEGTDVVTVNGTPLVRGVDYTIDAAGNSACNASSKNAHSNFATSITGLRSSGYSTYPFGVAGTSGTTDYGIGTVNSPLVFDMGYDVECNAMFIDGIAHRRATTSAATTTLVLEYSSDKSAWTEAVRADVTTYNINNSASIPAIHRNKLASFSPVTARYWRVYATADSGSGGYGSAFGNSFIGKVGKGIEFTNPPAKDAIITIAAQVDRPFKTSDYVIDYTLSYYY